MFIMQSKKTAGFTLMEMIIVMAIIAILVAVGVPSYQSYIKDSRRVSAQSELNTIAAALERYYFSNNSSYLGFDLPALTKDIQGHYSISFSTEPARNSFTLRMTPTGGQQSDPCGYLELNHLGVYSNEKTGNGCD
jgi:type IV pilus assembly protein PilE